jgi:flagellar biosynthesis protein FliQ
MGGAVGYFLLWVSLRKAESAAEETQTSFIPRFINLQVVAFLLGIYFSKQFKGNSWGGGGGCSCLTS